MFRLGRVAVCVAVGFPLSTLADITSASTDVVKSAGLNLDTGATGAFGGDLVFDGANLTPQGFAVAYNLGTIGATGYSGETEQQLEALAPMMTNAAIPVSSHLVIAVKTNGLHYAKVLIDFSNKNSATVEFTTYGASTGGTGPAITEVQNNYSYISPGLPNYGISPGTLFIVKGTGLAAAGTVPVLWNLASGPLPISSPNSNGTSISVTVNGTTVTPGIYYISPGQVAAVLPSSTPLGTGAMTVTFNGQASNTIQFPVVQSALGFDTLGGTGSGQAVAQDAGFNLFSAINSSSPGQAIILWGSGVGADVSNDDRTYPLKQNNLTNVPLTIYIGGIAAQIAYQGRSQFPGVDQVVVTIPPGISVGCNVSVTAVSGSIVSNVVTIPVAQGGGPCSDPASGTNPSALQALSGKGSVNIGSLSIHQTTEISPASGTTTGYGAGGAFYRYTVASLLAAAASGSVPSIGSCLVYATAQPATRGVGLDAGVISIAGPGVQMNVTAIPSQPGTYDVITPELTVAGTYTFTNGNGGNDVGTFSVPVNFATPLVWTNQVSTSTVNRSAGQTITWTGGAPNSYVGIQAQSVIATANGAAAATVSCYAEVGQGHFTIPSWALLALPPNNKGTLSVSNVSIPQNFSPPGLDFGYFSSESLTDTGGVTYQ